jgi:hypothetical protein
MLHPAFNQINFWREPLTTPEGHTVPHPLSPEGQGRRLNQAYGAEVGQLLLNTEAADDDALPREAMVKAFLAAGGKIGQAVDALTAEPTNNNRLQTFLNGLPKFNTRKGEWAALAIDVETALTYTDEIGANRNTAHVAWVKTVQSILREPDEFNVVRDTQMRQAMDNLRRWANDRVRVLAGIPNRKAVASVSTDPNNLNLWRTIAGPHGQVSGLQARYTALLAAIDADPLNDITVGQAYDNLVNYGPFPARALPARTKTPLERKAALSTALQLNWGVGAGVADPIAAEVDQAENNGPTLRASNVTHATYSGLRAAGVSAADVIESIRRLNNEAGLQSLLFKMQHRNLNAANLLALLNGGHVSFGGKNYFLYNGVPAPTIEAELYVRYNTWTPFGTVWGGVVHIHYPTRRTDTAPTKIHIKPEDKKGLPGNSLDNIALLSALANLCTAEVPNNWQV